MEATAARTASTTPNTGPGDGQTTKPRSEADRMLSEMGHAVLAWSLAAACLLLARFLLTG